MPLPLLLRCAVLGKRSVLTMEVDSESYVVMLGQEIAEKQNLPLFVSGRVQLFLAKPNGNFDHAWLKTTDPEYEELIRGNARVTAVYANEETRMFPGSFVASYFPGQPDAQAQTIHVLARLPTEDEQTLFCLQWRGYRQEEAKKELAKLKGQTSLDGAQQTEPFYQQILTPLRDSVASLTAWITPPEKTQQHVEKPKAKAA